MPKDLVRESGSPDTPREYRPTPQFKVCKHCGQRYEYYRYMDAAGSMDWDYRPVEE